MTAHVRGWLFEAGRSAAEPVVLKVETTGDVAVTGVGGVVVRAFAWREAQVDERIGDTERRLILPDGAAIEIADNDAVDALERAFGRSRGRFIAALERRWLAALGAVVVTVLASWMFIAFGMPVLADLAAARIPPSYAAVIDAQVLETVSTMGLRGSDLPEERRADVQRLLERLAAGVPGNSGWHYRLVFYGARRLGANAFALPGGTIIVTDGLVNLAKNDDQIAAVLAHEIAHVELRHGLRLMTRNAGLGAVTLFIFGDLTTLSHVFVSLPIVLLTSSYSRNFESDADAGAVEYLRRAHVPPEALVEMLELLQRDCGARCSEAPGWLSNHPLMPERLAAIRARIAAP